MKFYPSHTLFYCISLLWPLTLLTLGGWWLYLLYQLATRLSHFEGQPMAIELERWVRMIKWEGGIFFLLLLIATTSFVIIYLQHYRRSVGLQNFLAAIGHDLKTPLACVRLQAEVIQEGLCSGKKALGVLSDISNQLVGETQKLEFEFDKLLHLSRIHFTKSIPLQRVALLDLVKNVALDYPLLTIDLKSSVPCGLDFVYAQEHCVQMVLRNLFSNTIKHSSARFIRIILESKKNMLDLQYFEVGVPFKGNIKKLGKLFHFHHANANRKEFQKPLAGIGLYLSKQLMQQMNGKMYFYQKPELLISLMFLKK